MRKREAMEESADEQFDDENFKKRHDSMSSTPVSERDVLMNRTWTLVNGKRWG
jgi:hypothetical protein